MISIKQERLENETDDSGDRTMEDHSSDQSGDDTSASFIAKSSKLLKIVRKCTGCQEPCKTKLEVYQHTAKCCPHSFKCAELGCPFASVHKQHLDYHMNWHNKKKDIKCEKCQYTCSTKTMLKSHMRSHQGFMRFRCADCNVTTKQPSALSQHLSSTGHKAAPVLKEDGNEPDNEKDGDFKAHIRPKRRMKEAPQIVLPKKIRREILQQSTDSNMNLPANNRFELPIRIEPIETSSESEQEQNIVTKNEPIEVESNEDSALNHPITINTQTSFQSTFFINLQHA